MDRCAQVKGMPTCLSQTRHQQTQTRCDRNEFKLLNKDKDNILVFVLQDNVIFENPKLHHLR